MKKLILIVLSLFFAAYLHATPENVKGIVTMNFDMSQYPQGKKVRLWFPYPVSNKYQDITDIKITGNFAKNGVYAEKKYGNLNYYAEWDKNAKKRVLTFSFKVKRIYLKNYSYPEKALAWNKNDFRTYLQGSELAPINNIVKNLAQKIIKGKKNIPEKARAIYLWVCKNTYRNPKTRGCGKGDICKLLKDPGGKCADISTMFVTLCRAAGIPAREIFGIRLSKKNTQDITKAYHCWTQFYIPGYGWYSVDPADVRKMMLIKNLSWNSEKTKYYLKFYWEGIEPYRIKLSTGKDLFLNPAQKKAPLNYLMYPYVEIDGKPIDYLAPKSFKYSVRWKSVK
jgi:transglutaminase-like putative cysteine protease